MPQPSIPYACGRIGVLRRTALQRAQLDRLTAAFTYAEANRVLADIGFTAADSTDFQAAADAHVLKACKLIEAVTPDPRVTDCFLLRYDVHNLKTLFKSRHLAQKPQFLSACGTLRVDALRHAVADHTYAALPQALKACMESLEKQSAVKFDPMLVDTELDRAMYRQIFLNLEASKFGKHALAYFQAKVDLQNVIMLLRLKAMGKDAAFFLRIALPGGKADPKALANAFDENERLARSLRLYGPAVHQAALAAIMDPARLPFLEKTADDYLYHLFAQHRYDADSIEMLLSYLVQKQREATDVRLIMAGKLNGFKPEAVTERVRELHG